MDGVDEAFGQLKSSIEKQRQSLHDESTTLQGERHALEEEKRVMSQIKRDDDIITLNISGHISAIKRSTLIQIPGSLFSQMFSGRWEDRLDRDKDGNVFLDYNYSFTEKILDYLRALKIKSPERTLPKPEVTDSQWDDFNDFLQYLALDEHFSSHILTPKKDRFISYPGMIISIENDGLMARGSGNPGWAVGERIVDSGSFTWKFHVSNNSGYVMHIGVAYTLPPYNDENGYGPSCFFGITSNYSVAGGQAYGQMNIPSQGVYEGNILLDCDQMVLTITSQGSSAVLSLKGNRRQLTRDKRQWRLAVKLQHSTFTLID
eukprot:TRINITY_DN6896_c0_g1_i3.p1 TRINITY_DN6896_c0_g1~~TRINITY_DN6896_c0_g1_i3.p1  ORF type:complete len:318 (+),score=70.57 TRINITY_DN6896_c0_g1_i3:41-994(+)